MVILCYENFVELNKKHEYISYISKVYKNHIFCACKFLYTIINVQQIDGVIVIYTQLTFGSLDNRLCNNTRDNIIEFPIKKVKNYNENLEFTRHGKPKAKSANSVKTLEEIEKLKNTLSNMKNNIMINDLSGITPQAIRLNCRMIKDLRLIIIDYLQLMRSNSKYDIRNQKIGEISMELKKLAIDLNIPILRLSQLKRMSDENTCPSASGLRDSGEIEQNCNKLMLMWCAKKHKKSKTIGIDVALNRRGNTGVTLLNFCGETMTFLELNE